MVFNNIQSNILVHFADLLSNQDNPIYAKMIDNTRLSDMTTLAKGSEALQEQSNL